ncbi:DUF3795 domain-containing protein [Nanoarchaeota archaeon]
MKQKLIAPCGMNCNLCKAYLREKNKCPGCRNITNPKSDYFKKCTIKNCEIIKKNNWKYCSIKCEKFPCTRLKNLDKRYKTKYCMSMIGNLKNINNSGIRKFIKNEEKRWIKNKKIFCVHDKKYY